MSFKNHSSSTALYFSCDSNIKTLDSIFGAGTKHSLGTFITSDT
jgi:hypothetical protein